MDFRGAIALLLLFCIQIFCDVLVEESSFGHTNLVAPNSDGIPHFKVTGEGHEPQKLSNKVILTPLYPGNLRGAIWAEQKNSVPEWKADFLFRASGPERGGGNLQLWYANDGAQSIGTSSVYTAGKFEGLAILIDNQGGRGGSIRGFLNDGSIDFKSHPHIEGLAFGHCDYAYRNLGRPTRLTIKLSNAGLEVLVDDNRCFGSDQISLPKFYTFGITAASSETPDSFEIFKFMLNSLTASSQSDQNVNQGQSSSKQQPIGNEGQSQKAPDMGNAVPPTDPDDNTPASHYRTSDAQFADLHNRLQMMNHAISNVFKQFTSHTQREEERFKEILSRAATADNIASLDQRLKNIERTIEDLKRDFHEQKGETQRQKNENRERLDRLDRRMNEMHITARDHLPETVGNCKSPTP
ncbi:MAG: hypothetical protein Q9227_008716 [Pyrenula ochraceoflavens]